MLGATAAVLTLLGGPSWAGNIMVTNAHNTGPGSLRQAIKDANLHSGPDWIIFHAGMADKSIAPTSPLPEIVDDQTTIKGDIDNDGKPDVVLDGMHLSTGAGLVIKRATHCQVIGLAIVTCPETGLRLQSAHQAEVRSCYLGVLLNGWESWGNGGLGGEQVELVTTDNARAPSRTANTSTSPSPAPPSPPGTMPME